MTVDFKRFLGTFLLLCSIFSRVTAQENSPLVFSGSVWIQTGWLGLRSSLSDSLTRDWYSLISSRAVMSLEESSGRFLAEGWTEYDIPTGIWNLSLDQVWVQWQPHESLGLRLGRSAMQFGPCVSFSPANLLGGIKNSLDSRSGKVGLDGLFMEWQVLSPEGEEVFPLSLTLNTALVLPLDRVGEPTLRDLGASDVHGRLTIILPEWGILGQTEIGAAGNLRDLERSTDITTLRSLGLWLCSDLAGFVIGAEGALRDSGYASAFTLNRKEGDFFVLTEASWDSQTHHWVGFAQFTWAVEDLRVSLSGQGDLETKATRSAWEIGWNATDFLVLKFHVIWNYLPELLIPSPPTDLSAGLVAECFF